MNELVKKIQKYLEKGENLVLCRVIEARGSTPREVGAKMLVFENGEIFGTIGGGAVEYHAILLAIEVHQTKQSCTKWYDLSEKDKSDIGMICGGDTTVLFQYFDAGHSETRAGIADLQKTIAGGEESWLITSINADTGFSMKIAKNDTSSHFPEKATIVKGESILLIEPLLTKGKVYIFGGGHVAQALVPEIKRVGFSPVVFEDRIDFCKPELFSGAAKTVFGCFADIQASLKIEAEDFVVIMTRGHLADYTVVRQTLQTNAAYIGMIGSRKKIKKTHEKLQEEGFSLDTIQRIHNPIGIEIFAESPEEIAVSITAELIKCRAENRIKSRGEN